MQTYEELRGGGAFVVVADFEIPIHMELVQLVATTDDAACAVDMRGGRRQSGQCGLKFTAGSPDDAVVISNTKAKQWYLKRDWRDYDLLMLSVLPDRPGLSLDVQIVGGKDDDRTAVHAPIALHDGWNTIRLDLAEVAERVPLDDIREIRLRVLGADAPATVMLDDLILTAHRQALLGDPRRTDGELYVERAGRRWNVGAGGRFEITFANGQIVRWHHLQQDPYRLRNLVEGTTLGPSPMITSEGDADLNALGRQVVVRSRIVEMNRVRAVLACEWRFVEDPSAPLLDRPFERWEYVIYPTGQVYVTVECTARTGDWSADQVGLSVTLATRPGDGLLTQTSQGTRQPPTFAAARAPATDAFLLFALNEPQQMTTMRERLNDRQGRASLIASRAASGSDVERWTCTLVLGSAESIADEEAIDRAAAFADPVPLAISVGSIADEEQRTGLLHGLDQTDGCYVLSPEHGQLRFTIDGRDRPVPAPAFTILDSQDRQAWVYVDHMIHDALARDAQGNLLFQIPHTIKKHSTVEVLFRGSGMFDGT